MTKRRAARQDILVTPLQGWGLSGAFSPGPSLAGSLQPRLSYRGLSARRQELSSSTHASWLAVSGAGAFGQGVAEFGAGFFGFGFEAGDDFGMLRGNVRGFADVVFQIVKLGFFELAVLVRRGQAVVAAGLAAQGAIS